jgi:hypothetical protein
MAKRFLVPKFASDMNGDRVVNYLDLGDWIVWVVMYPGRRIVQDFEATRPGHAIFKFFDINNPVVIEFAISVFVYYAIAHTLLRFRDKKTRDLVLNLFRRVLEELPYQTGFRKRPTVQEKIQLTIRNTQPPTSQAASLITAQNLLRNGEYLRAASMFAVLKEWNSAIEAYRRVAAREKRYFLEIAQIHFSREENLEGLRACMASDDLSAVVQAALRMRAWEELMDFMLSRETSPGEFALLDGAFWQECLVQLTPGEKVGRWLALCAMGSGSFEFAERVLEFYQMDPEANGRFWMQLEMRTVNDIVTGLLAQADAKRYPVGFLARCAHGLYVAQLFLQAGLLYEREDRAAMAGKCFAFSGDLEKGRELLQIACENGIAARLTDLIVGLSQTGDWKNGGTLPREKEYQLRQILAPLDPAVDVSHAASPFLLKR